MPYTDKSDLFVSVHEDGINLVVKHIMQQRPSYFNFATPYFLLHKDKLCAPVDASDEVIDGSFPQFTLQAPLPVLGMVVPWGLDYCLQLTHAELDFHPNNVINLPDQMGKLAAQHFALRLRGCLGVGCPEQKDMGYYIDLMERMTVLNRETLIELDEDEAESSTSSASGLGGLAGTLVAREYNPLQTRPQDYLMVDPPDYIPLLPLGELQCFCLEIFAEGHFEWGLVGDDPQYWLKPRLDRIEIVDLELGTLEDIVECYLKTVLELGIFPRLIIPMEKLILNITEMLEDTALTLNEQVTLEPSRVPQDVPHNPAIEKDLLKAYIRLVVD